MVEFSYIASALGFGIMPTGIMSFEQKEGIRDGLQSLASILNEKVTTKCHHTNPTIAGLFNAYTEAKQVEDLKYTNNCGLHALYADSGGLQIITAGKTVSDAMKDQIYVTQTNADYAMVFDVIPLKKDETKERTRNERSNFGNRTFAREEVPSAGYQTGVNTSKQIEYFRSIGANTKVILIVQGNDAETMVDFYRNLSRALKPEDYEYITGLAASPQCIGNSPLETIEMLRAVRLISNECHPNVAKQLHILGVGSLEKLRPAVYLKKSGYLDKFEVISYDSSSHTSCFDYGLLKTNGGCISLGRTKTKAAESHFLDLYFMFEQYLYYKLHITHENFLNLIFGLGKYNDNDTLWKYSIIKNRVLREGNTEEICAGLLSKAMHTYFQIVNFVENVDKMWTEYAPQSINVRTQALNKTRHQATSYLMALRHVKDDASMNEWMKEFYHIAKSRRIKDKSITTLEEFII